MAKFELINGNKTKRISENKLNRTFKHFAGWEKSITHNDKPYTTVTYRRGGQTKMLMYRVVK